ncbi:uncharacterized protein BP5553_03932 [Venustampulla echinocandica]|uniref:Uncharacterized protein n=1 Tax=Venustampulla echinocandica TaxID=2656787 RepID=A0A370TVP0_9HELO|nr:uncharacterized protein BP5553_03932 [Venustampulla echinocandica]RDL39592.1 hypothetical protein BP5553_03932 [Venustampulla echinocandica]
MANHHTDLRPPLFPLNIETIRNGPLFQFDDKTRYMVTACRAYGYKLGYHQILDSARNALNSGEAQPMCLVLLPPVPALSTRQSMAMLAMIDIDMTPRSWEWSPEFISIYGSLEGRADGLWAYCSDFRRVISTTIDQRLFPHYKRPFIWLAKNLEYLGFCENLDRAAVQKNIRVLDRNEMEAAWVQVMMRSFEWETHEAISSLIGKVSFHREVTSEAQARVVMQHFLRTALKKRYQPVEKVEKYWEEKPAKYNVPDLNITPTPDGSSELPGELNTDFEDEDDEGDVAMAEGGETQGVVEMSNEMRQMDLDDDDEEAPASGHTREEILEIISAEAESEAAAAWNDLA